MSESNALRKGCKLGFEHAREHPEQSLGDYLAAIDDFQEQLSATPSWKLRLLTGKGTWLDRFRLKYGSSQ